LTTPTAAAKGPLGMAGMGLAESAQAAAAVVAEAVVVVTKAPPRRVAGRL